MKQIKIAVDGSLEKEPFKFSLTIEGRGDEGVDDELVEAFGRFLREKYGPDFWMDAYEVIEQLPIMKRIDF